MFTPHHNQLDTNIALPIKAENHFPMGHTQHMEFSIVVPTKEILMKGILLKDGGRSQNGP
jgi:hypothetical protein